MVTILEGTVTISLFGAVLGLPYFWISETSPGP